jgi:putative ABC transport system permease protein
LLNLNRIAQRTIVFYKSSTLLVALGVAAATAVILGALLVGDSVRGSLKGLVMDRLGRIEWMLLAPNFFEQTAVERLTKSNALGDDLDQPIPAIVFPRGTVEIAKGDLRSRSGSVLVIATTEAYWSLGDGSRPVHPTGNEVILNKSLADELGVSTGDEVTLRLPAEQAVPADSPLGKRDEQSEGIPRLKVVGIVPDQGLGGFDIRGSQRASRNIFVPLATVQRALRREGTVNCVFIGSKNSQPVVFDAAEAEQQGTALLGALNLELQDFGVEVERIQRNFPDADRRETSDLPVTTIYDYYHITSGQLLFMPEMESAIRRAIPVETSDAVMTYLANGIELKNASNPDQPNKVVTYSTISGTDFGSTFSFDQPKNIRGLNQGECMINSWLSDALNAKVGDELLLHYYLPETSHGKEIETSFHSKIVGIVPITKPISQFDRRRLARYDKAPTIFNDPNLTPEVPGITDQDSISDWDLPFVLERKASEEDDLYWKEHRLTPKVFLSLAESQERFGSRFGKVSSFRVSTRAGLSLEDLQQRMLAELRKSSAELGFVMTPIRSNQLRAASGTTPFDMLFLSLSFFVIISALLLVSLLFRLGVEQRADQLGLLSAMGWSPEMIRGLLMREAALTSILGSALGIGLGFGYAYLMILGLKTWWVGAVSTPFLQFHWTPLSVAIGFIAGVLVTWISTAVSIRRLIRLPATRLLRGQTTPQLTRQRGRSKWLGGVIVGLGLLAIAIGAVGYGLSGQAQAGAFVGSGMLLLTAALLETFRRLRTVAGGNAAGSANVSSLPGLAAKNVRCNPLRSSLAVGLISVAAFLVLAMSLFQAKPDLKSAGGFELMAESSLPIVRDLNSAEFQRQILGSKASQLADTAIVPFRLRAGDDASCNNLFQSTQPRVLGVPESLAVVDAGQPVATQFPWAAKASEKESPWQSLSVRAKGTQDDPLPVVLDQNTAMWSLHRGASIGEVFSFEFAQKQVYFRTVGLLQNTTLQGSLLIGEKNFESVFPEVVGFQFFLVRPSKDAAGIATLLESGWGDEGLDVIRSADVLQQLFAVQNTYLSAFQALGALGLLLGTFGLAVVQIRSVMERRGELALMRAVGFPGPRIGMLLFAESATLLLLGAGLGAASAIVSALPVWLRGQSISEFQQPALMMLIVIIVGLFAGAIAVLRALKLPILDALRGR